MLPLVLAKVLGVSHFDTVGNYKEIFPVLRFCLDYPNPSDYASPKETVCFYLKNPVEILRDLQCLSQDFFFLIF